jgi:hypothetical protein
MPTFEDKGCQVVSVTDPYGRILDFLDRKNKAALRLVFFKYFEFPCQLFHRRLHTHHYPSSRGWYSKPNNGQCAR